MFARISTRAVGKRLLCVLMLLGCGSKADPLLDSSLTLPDCLPGQFLLVNYDRSLSCMTPFWGPVVWPTCPEGTHALNISNGNLICVAKGTGTTSSELARSITDAIAKAANLDAQIRAVSVKGTKYCGQTTNTFTGRFLTGTQAGLAAMNSNCALIPSCGTGAHLCSVYEMYDSVAAGVIGSAMEIAKSWVYMASWSQEFSDDSGSQEEAGAGFADNCGGFTAPDSNKKWYGTAVQWTLSDSGQKALKFFSGPTNVGIPGTTTQVTNPGAVACSSMLPAVCCR